MNGTATRAHRIHDGYATRGDVVTVANAPRRFPRYCQTEIVSAIADQREELSGSFIDWLGRAVETTVEVTVNPVFARYGSHAVLQHALCGNHVVG